MNNLPQFDQQIEAVVGLVQRRLCLELSNADLSEDVCSGDLKSLAEY